MVYLDRQLEYEDERGQPGRGLIAAAIDSSAGCRSSRASIAGEGIGLASITVWEILNGIGRLDPGRRRDDLVERFQGLLDELFEGRIFDWTLADAQACARIMEQKRRQGEPLDDHLPDAFLAAAAACRGLAVVTRKSGEFRNTGIEVIDPWDVT